MTEEIRRKISLSKIGSKHTPETKKKMSLSHKKAWKQPSSKMKKVYRNLKKGIRKNQNEILYQYFDKSFVDGLTSTNKKNLIKIQRMKNYLHRFGYDYQIIIDYSDDEINSWTLFSKFKTENDQPSSELVLRAIEYAGISNRQLKIYWEESELESQIIIQFLNDEGKK